MFEWGKRDGQFNGTGMPSIYRFFKDFEDIGGKIVDKNRQDSSSINYTLQYKDTIYYVSITGTNGYLNLFIKNHY